MTNFTDHRATQLVGRLREELADDWYASDKKIEKLLSGLEKLPRSHRVWDYQKRLGKLRKELQALSTQLLELPEK